MMLYFDTDVIVHYIIVQDEGKHKIAQKVIKKAISSNSFCISTLTFQELAFVLAKLKLDIVSIKKNLDFFMQFAVVSYSKNEIEKAFKIAESIGYRSINDCIHTVIAEKYCKKLVTFNKNDFNKIQKITNLEIIVL